MSTFAVLLCAIAIASACGISGSPEDVKAAGLSLIIAAWWDFWRLIRRGGKP